MTNNNEYLLKIAITGSNTSSNANFGNQTADNKWTLEQLSTLGCIIPTKKIMIESIQVKLILLVVAGEENFAKQRPQLYRGSVAGIIIFEKKDQKAFTLVSAFHKEFKKVLLDSVPIAIVGIHSNTENVSEDEGKQLADRLKCHYFETDLTDNTQIEEIFRVLARQVIDNK
jgi:GTPase SAR1 family protein